MPGHFATARAILSEDDTGEGPAAPGQARAGRAGIDLLRRRPAWVWLMAIVWPLAATTPGLVQGQEPGPETSQRAVVRAVPPPFPAGLDDPAIDMEELEIRLLPLTVAELDPLAEAWLGNLRAATQAVADKILELRAASPDDAPELREERLALAGERLGVIRKFGVVVASLEAKGGDSERIETLRAYPSGIAMMGASRLSPRDLAENFVAWLKAPRGGVQVALRALVLLGALLALLVMAETVRRFARHLFSRVPDISKLLVGFLSRAAFWLTVAIGLMWVLAAMGLNITPLFALFGGASFILAFAMQDTLGNLAAGLMIMVNRPFDEGHFVTVAGVSGTVARVSTVSTTISTPDNQVVVIPNSKVWGDVITNATVSNTRRVDLVFGVAYDASISEAYSVLEEIVTSHPMVLDNPPPLIRVDNLGPSSVDMIVRPWVEAQDHSEVRWDLTRQVKEAFDERGISLPPRNPGGWIANPPVPIPGEASG